MLTVYPHITMNGQEVNGLVTLFSKACRLAARIHGTLKAEDAVNILHDNIDTIAHFGQAPSGASSSSPSKDGVGFMALGDIDRLRPGGNMPTVDVNASKDIWAVLDEGCNSSVHGSGWADRAEKKLARFGLEVLWTSRKAKWYSGISTPIFATGKRAIPFCLSLDDGTPISAAHLEHAPGDARACQGHAGRDLHVERLPGAKAATVQSTWQRAYRGQHLGVR